MATAIQRWGNSLGLRIPKAIAEQVQLHEGTEVTFDTAGGRLSITPVRRKKQSLTQLLAKAKGPNPHGEWDTSAPGGRESI